jgi:hypothetical protein
VSGVKGSRWGHFKPCPSWSAYKHHIDSREVPCEPCRQFVNDARRARRAAERAEAAWRASAAEWRAEHEASVRRLQERAVRQLVALLAEAAADERRRSRAA